MTTVIGDARHLPFPACTFDAIIDSPVYGNRVSDHHDARDGTRRITYRHSGTHPAQWSAAVLDTIASILPADIELVLDPCAGVGAARLADAIGVPVIGVEIEKDWASGGKREINAPLRAGNTGAMQWGVKYRATHLLLWREAARVLTPRGWFVLNVSDHYRAGERAPVVQWHVDALKFLGFRVERILSVQTPRMKFGANRERVPCEYVILLRLGG